MIDKYCLTIVRQFTNVVDGDVFVAEESFSKKNTNNGDGK